MSVTVTYLSLQVRKHSIHVLDPRSVLGEERPALILLFKCAYLAPEDVGVRLFFKGELSPQARLLRARAEAVRQTPVHTGHTFFDLATACQNLNQVHCVIIID